MSKSQFEKDYSAIRSVFSAIIYSFIFEQIMFVFGVLLLLYYPIHGFTLWKFGEIGFWYVIVSGFSWVLIYVVYTRTRRVRASRRDSWRNVGRMGIYYGILLFSLDKTYATPRICNVETPFGFTSTFSRHPGETWNRMSFPDYDEKMAKVKIEHEQMIKNKATIALNKERVREEIELIELYGLHTADYWNIGDQADTGTENRRYILDNPQKGYKFWQDELIKYKSSHPDYVDAERRLKQPKPKDNVDELISRAKLAAKLILEQKEQKYVVFAREFAKAGNGKHPIESGMYDSDTRIILRYVTPYDEGYNNTRGWEDLLKQGGTSLKIFEREFVNELERLYKERHPQYQSP